MVTMPVYNESQGLKDFLTEIFDAFEDIPIRIHVVDDCSTDGTGALLVRLQADFGNHFSFSINEKNLGHGPSTLKGIATALQNFSFDYLMTVDGDGNFIGADLFQAYKLATDNNCEILEGVRILRRSPIFRRATTKGCQILIKRTAHLQPQDANTPLRVYRNEVISRISAITPPHLLTPNLFISAYSRISGLDIIQLDVPIIESRSLDKSGTTWKQKITWFPSKRFLKFCYLAIVQWNNDCLKILQTLSR